MNRHRQSMPAPTGDASTSSSEAWPASLTAGSAHTKGAWQQAVASTTIDTYGLMVFNSTATSSSATDTSMLVDIGVGGAGAEVPIVSNLAMGWRTDKYMEYRVPVYIPRGTRIAARCQSAVASASVGVILVPMARSLTGQTPHGFGIQPWGFSGTAASVAGLNANTATSKGTNLTIPGANNTKGAWVELVTTTAESYTALMVGVQGAADTTQGATTQLIDIGVGASGSEVVVVPNIYTVTASSEAVTVPDSGAWLVDVPAGSRIAARYQLSSITNTNLDVIVYGIR